MTGYTYQMIEENQTFAEFALSCVRAFFHVPEEEEGTDAFRYHQAELAKAQAELSELTAMTDQQQYAYGYQRKDEAVREALQCLRDTEANVARLQAMLDQVNAWEPPTPKHHALKDFMIQQLADSIKHEWLPSLIEEMEKIKQRLPAWFYQQAWESAEWGVDYHSTRAEKEAEDRQSRQEWLEQLRESLAAREIQP